MKKGLTSTKKGGLYILATMLIILTGCSAESQKKSTNENNTPKVRVAAATSANETTLFKYSGTIEAYRTVPLSFQVSGTVESVNVSAGDRVQKGQILAKIDPTDLQASYNGTKAKYEQALDAYKRLKEVYEKGSLSDIKWVETTTGLEQAKSMLELTESSLRKSILRASESGIIGEKNIEPGMSSIQVNSSFTIVDIKKVYVKIAVPEQEILSIKKGGTATIKVTASNNKLYLGTIETVGVVSDPVSRTYEVKILINNEAEELRPGMLADVNLVKEANNGDLPTIPAVALTTTIQGDAAVYLLDKNQMKVILTPVTTGPYSGNNIVILSGLKVGDEVVVAGKEKIYNQCPVVL